MLQRLVENLSSRLRDLSAIINGSFAPALNVLSLNAGQSPSALNWDGMLWAVPKHRRAKNVCQTRRMSFPYLLSPKKNHEVCPKCGTWKPFHTICGTCYEKVRQETERIKAAMKYDGVEQKEILVRYKGEASSEEEGTGLRLVEIPTKRPDWFSPQLQKKWRKALE